MPCDTRCFIRLQPGRLACQTSRHCNLEVHRISDGQHLPAADQRFLWCHETVTYFKLYKWWICLRLLFLFHSLNILSGSRAITLSAPPQLRRFLHGLRHATTVFDSAFLCHEGICSATYTVSNRHWYRRFPIVLKLQTLWFSLGTFHYCINVFLRILFATGYLTLGLLFSRRWLSVICSKDAESPLQLVKLSSVRVWAHRYL